MRTTLALLGMLLTLPVAGQASEGERIQIKGV